MKYVIIDATAIDEIVSSRTLQSTEFEQGKTFASLLVGQAKSAILSPTMSMIAEGDGLAIFGSNVSKESKYVVIDIEQSKIFEILNESEALFATQKLLRFIKKLWGGLSLTHSEKMIAGTSKSVLFPFQYRPAPFRIVIERDPMPDRLAKRDLAGNFLLVYKSGYESADGSKEVAELTNFRKALEALPTYRGKLNSNKESLSGVAPTVNQLQVSMLGGSNESASSIFRGYEEWLPMLTLQQKEFIDAPILGPHRIEGAAGTGKTLCLMLKAIKTLRAKEEEKNPYQAVFISHSDATKKAVKEFLSVIDPWGFSDRDPRLETRFLKVCTLSELCADQLRQHISASEFIDRDAMESKGFQLLYIAEALEKVMRTDYASHKRYLSNDFNQYLTEEDRWKVAEMLQHEISVVLKGRASEDFDRYRKIPFLSYGLPISSDADKGFVFTIFKEYQQRLGDSGQFDTDDVVLTAIGQLDTPIWRRRRVKEGYDAIFVDETHLFNMNELHIFHYFTRREGPYPIIYSVDRSQAVGDQGWNSDDIQQSITDSEEATKNRFNTIFRSSPQIANVAFSVVSSGATLFTNFDNPMEMFSSAFTETDEKLSREPSYFNLANEEALIEASFDRADKLQTELGCRKSDILVVSLDGELVSKLEKFAVEKNKPILLLKKRGDIKAVEAAKKSGQLVIAHADYVGGLEFYGVVIVGLDSGRVPPTVDHQSDSSKNFLAYSAHNRLYVAISRAKYRLEMLGEKARGPSKLIEPAIRSGLVTVVD
ncbi:UvrD-helicase domain-containing protein [Rhizobium leguminosarum]|uniref:UvrD-helicase domain-containing protein n=1 Tax=Rhizobium leguminosarum TaxID=384 RepID=UPI001C94DC1E|nr:UvrD-helicase domain-containing protein [Rhizobium leguminosarum]MBY5484663.1 UvrD-helicase domain-containing protein [Rhizobium leguminosarum]